MNDQGHTDRLELESAGSGQLQRSEISMPSLHRARLVTHSPVAGPDDRYCSKFLKVLGRWAMCATVSAAAVSSTAATAQAQVQLAETNNITGPSAPPQMAAQQHPLEPALDIAKQTKQYLDANLKDYSATVVKHERIDGTLGDPEYAFIKVRQEPFSVYMYFLAPKNLEGQECMYIANANNGNMFAHAPPGTLRGKFGTVSLAPNSAMAMKGQRYPITELGVANLVKRLIEVGTHDEQFGECDVQFFQGAKVNGRVCTMIQVTHPVPRRDFLFNVARIYLDDEMHLPIRYEAYEWPAKAGDPPVLLEEYTYMNLKINQGFTDADFDVHNPAYKFNMK
jgi:hypothetical protein